MNGKINILRYTDFPTAFRLIPYIWHYKFELLNIVYIRKYFHISAYVRSDLFYDIYNVINEQSKTSSLPWF